MHEHARYTRHATAQWRHEELPPQHNRRPGGIHGAGRRAAVPPALSPLTAHATWLSSRLAPDYAAPALELSHTAVDLPYNACSWALTFERVSPKLYSFDDEGFLRSRVCNDTVYAVLHQWNRASAAVQRALTCRYLDAKSKATGACG
eukprot:2315224-Prymnesium_polylepis.1